MNWVQKLLILILENSPTYEQRIRRLKRAGFKYNDEHYRWEIALFNGLPDKAWITDEAVAYDTVPEALIESEKAVGA